MPEQRDFSQTPLYPILFVILLSLVFVGTLATLYRGQEARIEDQKRSAYQKEIIEVCLDSLSSAAGMSAATLRQDYASAYSRFARELPPNPMRRRAFVIQAQKRTVAYVFDIPGKGLWGSMRALVALSADLQSIIGLTVYEQVETPGLGSRITEDWFTGQFRGKPVPDASFEYELIPEEQSPNGLQIRQVTGATITSRAVTDMLRVELNTLARHYKEQSS